MYLIGMAMPRRWLQHRRSVLPGLRGLLGAVEGFEETGKTFAEAARFPDPRKSPITLLTTSALRGCSHSSKR